MSPDDAFRIDVVDTEQGQRLDVLISTHLPNCSRSLAANLIAAEKVSVDGRPKKPGYRVRTGDRIQGCLPEPQLLDFKPEPIEINRIFEDSHIIVINKPAGLVVHPAPGHYSGTLVNALLYHCPDLKGIGGKLRPGIVHRLDKDTSGALVIAKSAAAQAYLAQQFKTRTVMKDYLAMVYGEFDTNHGKICLPIGRHPTDRKRMSVTSRRQREAETLWKISEQFKGMTLLELRLKTGRTHQIRVHCAAMGHPIVGDPVYHPRKLLKNLTQTFPGIPAHLVEVVKSAGRQMLHAWRLGFVHPETGEKMMFEAPLAEDMATLLNVLRSTRP
jgi:23S rRNA pseudouridine1911/1915/1917 synthase